MVDPISGGDASPPERAPGSDENVADVTDHASTKIVDTLPRALAFGVIAATIQMAIVLSLLYC
jgi:hypothetical protein